MEVRKSPVWIMAMADKRVSILNIIFAMKWFICFKLITGWKPPVHISTRKIIEMNSPGTRGTGEMAPFWVNCPLLTGWTEDARCPWVLEWSLACSVREWIPIPDGILLPYPVPRGPKWWPAIVRVFPRGILWGVIPRVMKSVVSIVWEPIHDDLAGRGQGSVLIEPW